LEWMVSALICSGQLSLPAWNLMCPVTSAECDGGSDFSQWATMIFYALVLVALSGWKGHRLYLLDTTVVWIALCIIHLEWCAVDEPYRCCGGCWSMAAPPWH